MKTIVMTGGTAGLGKVAAEQMARAPGTRLLLGARNSAAGSIETLPLDLARLSGVRAFAKAVDERLGPATIDALVLNAGTQFPNIDHVSEDGFETTFAVNHLAHYLLVRLLLPKLTQGAIVVITASDTHDPAINPLAPPLHADATQLAHPKTRTSRKERAFIAGFRAYSSSKLCNILTARALAAEPGAKAGGLTVIAYNPGFTPGTALGRAWPCRSVQQSEWRHFCVRSCASTP